MAPFDRFLSFFFFGRRKEEEDLKRKTGYRINPANTSFWRRRVSDDAKLSSIARRGPETAVVGSAASYDTAEKASDWLAVLAFVATESLAIKGTDKKEKKNPHGEEVQRANSGDNNNCASSSSSKAERKLGICWPGGLWRRRGGWKLGEG